MTSSGSLLHAVKPEALATRRNAVTVALVSVYAKRRAPSCATLTGIAQAMKTSLLEDELVDIAANMGYV